MHEYLSLQSKTISLKQNYFYSGGTEARSSVAGVRGYGEAEKGELEACTLNTPSIRGGELKTKKKREKE